jgi:hypothetical protein
VKTSGRLTNQATGFIMETKNEDGVVESEAIVDSLVENESQTQPQETATETDQEQRDQAKADKAAEETHGFDKVRQQVQQELANKLRPIESRLDELVNRLASAPTPAEKAEVKKEAEQVQDELDALTNANPDDLDLGKAVPMLAKAVKGRVTRIEDENKRLRQALDEARQESAPARQVAYREQWKGEFARLNPDMADRADDAYKTFSDSWSEMVDPSEQLPPATQKRLATLAYQKALESVKKSKEKPAPPPRGVRPAGRPTAPARPTVTDETEDDIVNGLTGGDD